MLTLNHKKYSHNEGNPVVKNLHIEVASVLKIFFISMSLGVLFLSTLYKSVYNCRFISLNICTNTLTRASNGHSSTYRNLILRLLILFYFIMFDFYFIIFLPSEFFEVQLLTKNRTNQACRFVKFFSLQNFQYFIVCL